jgi:DNA relaxase NicK
MEISYCYDWVSATMPQHNVGYLEQSLVLGAELDAKDDAAKNGYDRSNRYESGAVVMWSSTREDMGIHLVLSGSCLKWMHEHGQDSQKALMWVNKLGGRVSRIDLAIDVKNSGLNMVDVCKPNRLPYKGRGRTPKLTPVGDEEDGWTVYIGSRSSDKFLRIYDKALEQGDKNADWIRIELECKGLVAHYLGETLSKGDVSAAYAIASQLCSAMVNFKTPVWNAALSERRVEISIPKPSSRDTLAWLVGVCAPSLARVAAERPSDDIMGIFVTALRKELQQRGIDLL